MRKVHVGAEVWEYEMGRSCVSIRDPHGKRKLVSYFEIKPSIGKSSFYERPWSVTPGDIAAYIERNLVP